MNNNTDVKGGLAAGGGLSGKAKLIVLALLVIVVGLLAIMFRKQLSIAFLAEQEVAIRAYQSDHPVLIYAVALLIYVAVTGLMLPGAAGMSLVYGWFFGFWPALIVVSFASTSGATLAFLLSRYFLRGTVQQKFGDRLAGFNEALRREGAFYLFTLRLIPAVPFFVINTVMGLTPIRVWTFWWVSQLGMLAGTCAFVFAGSTLPSLEQIENRSLLRAEEIKDWPGLVGRLQGASDTAVTSPADQIRALLPKEAESIIQRGKMEQQLTKEEKKQLVLAFNELIKGRQLALTPPWQEVPLEPDDIKDISKLNRMLLQRAFPDQIGPPQPILKPQLLVAFIVLGIFPLAVKKMMGWVRGAEE